jgi:N-acetylmuramoyl-L-alanine amidase
MFLGGYRKSKWLTNLLAICLLILTVFGGLKVEAREVVEVPRVDVIEPESVKAEKSTSSYFHSLYDTLEPIKSNVEGLQLSYEEEEMIARLIMAEAEGETDIGKILVMNVLINRVNSEEFPNTIKEVIFETGQFECVSNGRFYSVQPNDLCYEIVADAELEYIDNSQGALYFCEQSADQWHNENLKFLFQCGKHKFYK